MLTEMDRRSLEVPRVECARLQPTGVADLLVFAQAH
jgi:hypothetical protein